MCIIYLGNIIDVAIILKKILTVCKNDSYEYYSCSIVKLLQENIFFIILFTLGKF